MTRPSEDLHNFVDGEVPPLLAMHEAACEAELAALEARFAADRSEPDPACIVIAVPEARGARDWPRAQSLSSGRPPAGPGGRDRRGRSPWARDGRAEPPAEG